MGGANAWHAWGLTVGLMLSLLLAAVPMGAADHLETGRVCLVEGEAAWGDLCLRAHAHAGQSIDVIEREQQVVNDTLAGWLSVEWTLATFCPYGSDEDGDPRDCLVHQAVPVPQLGAFSEVRTIRVLDLEDPEAGVGGTEVDLHPDQAREDVCVSSSLACPDLPQAPASPLGTEGPVETRLADADGNGLVDGIVYGAGAVWVYHGGR